MSRAQLLAAARSLGIRTDAVRDGRRGVKDNNWLRVDILERCYGRNPGEIKAKSSSSAEIDERVSRAADCAVGRLGYLLSVAQGCIRDGRNELAEYERLRGLKRRKPEEETRLLRSAGEWLQIADIAQRLHEIETGLEVGP